MKNLIVFAIICTFYSCTKQDFSSCEGNYKEEVVKDGKKYSYVILNDTNFNWLNYTKDGRNVSYENGKGFSLIYWEKGQFSSNRYALNKYTKGEKEQCVGKISYEDFYYAQTEIMQYDPVGDGNSFHFKRYMDLKWDMDSNKLFILTSKREALYFAENFKNSYGYNQHSINTDTLFSSETQKFHNVIMLRNKNYKSVFELINVNANLPSIEIKGYYFSFNDGLLGYYLTNNELWLKK